MKKRFLSLLTAICLTLTLTPVAFAEEAQPDTITLPNGEVREIPVLDEIPMSRDVSDAPWSGSGTAVSYTHLYVSSNNDTQTGTTYTSQLNISGEKTKITGDMVAADGKADEPTSVIVKDNAVITGNITNNSVASAIAVIDGAAAVSYTHLDVYKRQA